MYLLLVRVLNSLFMFYRNNLYNVTVYYGGHFVHVPYFAYTSNVSKVYKHIDFENLSVNDLKMSFAAVVGDFDSLYYKASDSQIYLLNDENKPGIIELSKECGYNIKLCVYHVSRSNESDEERDGYECSDEEYVRIRKDSREERKKMDAFEREANLNEMLGMEYDDTSGSDGEFYPSSEESDEGERAGRVLSPVVRR